MGYTFPQFGGGVMPWRECRVMDEKVRFVARLMNGEQMTDLCREFGISRKTGYKILDRYKQFGVGAFTDRSRRPVRLANQLPLQVENTILRIKREKSTWGARKIRELIKRRFPDIRPPANSTIHAVLDRHGLVSPRGRRRNRALGTALSEGRIANDLWCADYKGEFMLGNRQYCYPLTITDHASRYLLACEGLTTTKEQYAFTVFENTFKEHGLPLAIRTDNGVPFASANSLFNLSKLSVWWLRLGIQIERIQPGQPQQNGRHERMHLTLKKETTKPAGENLLQQQAKFDEFLEEYNAERPHEALAMKTPEEVYTRSERSYRGISPIDYPLHDRSIEVTSCGRICIGKMKINLSQVFAGQKMGLKEVSDGVWLVTFMDYDLGYFDTESFRFEPLNNPFGPKVLPMS